MVEMNLRHEDPDGAVEETCARGECVVAFVIKGTEKAGEKMRYEVAGHIQGEGEPEGILKAAAYALGLAANETIKKQSISAEARINVAVALLRGLRGEIE